MSIGQIDYELFRFINELGSIVPFLNASMRFLAEYAFYLFFVGLFMYWFSRQERNRKLVVESVVSVLIGLGISAIIGYLFYRDRPFVAHPVLQLIPHVANASFPSDHSIGAFALAISFVIYRRKEGIAWLLLSVAIAFSRVWTGVHYPSDVLGGALIGISVAGGVHHLTKRVSFISHALKVCLMCYEKYESKILPRNIITEEKIPSGK